ncbi:MAG: hypothetical protein NVS3B26_07170 [Mycobacteriales bacterium]
METLVLVLTDVQGSARLWQDEPLAMASGMARHHEIVHAAIAEHDGWRPADQGEGDAVFAAFRSPTEAVAAVVHLQRALAGEPWSTTVPLKVRIGVHVGEVTERDGNLYGDPVNRCARLRGLGSGGQTLISAPVFELVRDKLPPGVSVTDLGEHRMKDLTRPEHVWQLDLDGLPNDFPPLASLDRVRHNLPVQLSSFLGRDEQIAQGAKLLAASRILSLTGPGGIGKTRTAYQLAADAADEFADGVWAVELASVSDPAVVPSALMWVLGLRDEPGRGAAQTLVSFLRHRHALVLLDNCEHLIDAAAELAAQLVGGCVHLRVLVTSREPLRVAGERVWALPPLVVPAAGEQRLDVVAAAGAVGLFCERAAEAKVGFALTAENVAEVGQICARLDGIPLAIELAAARVRTMPLTQIAARVRHSLDVLSKGNRGAVDRQASLRGAIAWSYELLTPSEKGLFQQLALFAGGFTLAAAEVVGANTAVEGSAVADTLGSLVDKSFVVFGEDGAGEGRYRMLETLRQYALDCVTESGGLVDARDRHLRWLLETVKAQEATIWFGPNDDVGLRRIDAEDANLRAGLDWAVTRQPGIAASLLVALLLWLVARAPRSGLDWCERLLATDLQDGDRSLVALVKLFMLSNLGGATPEQLDRIELDVWALSRTPYPWLEFVAVSVIAITKLTDEEPTAAQRTVAVCQAAVASARRSNATAASMCMQALAMAHSVAGDHESARSISEEALLSIANARLSVGECRQALDTAHYAVVAGDIDAAWRYAERAVEVSRRIGDRRMIYAGMTLLASLAATRDDHQAALELSVMALQAAVDVLGEEELADARRSINTFTQLARDAANDRPGLSPTSHRK